MANVHTTNLRLALMSDQHKNEIYKAFDQILISSLVMFEENFALSELEDECRTLKDRDPALRAVFIDDIEALAEVENESDFERNKITNRLCKLAKELRVTILVTTTLDEPTAGQEKLPPRISELKKCVNPNLAQDVFLLHRDIYEANAELIVAKEESGYCLPLALKFCSSSGKFTGFQPSEEALSLQSEAQVPSALREK
jgi:replicative DNA helicase